MRYGKQKHNTKSIKKLKLCLREAKINNRELEEMKTMFENKTMPPITIIGNIIVNGTHRLEAIKQLK